MPWYQCSACRQHIKCERRLNPEEMRKVQQLGDCPDYVYSCTTRRRSTFR